MVKPGFIWLLKDSDGYTEEPETDEGFISEGL